MRAWPKTDRLVNLSLKKQRILFSFNADLLDGVLGSLACKE